MSKFAIKKISYLLNNIKPCKVSIINIMNKFLASIIIMSVSILGMHGASPENVKLPAPDTKGGLPVMQAFANRKSVREYAQQLLSMQDISNLLWAAGGVNRADGHHTNPTALNKEDIDIYLFSPEGVFLYAPAKHELIVVAHEDHRDLIRGGQTDFPIPPVAVVMVSTPSRFGIDNKQASLIMGAADAGIVSENISLFCAGNGFVTVPRASMDSDAISALLGLQEGSFPVLNNPVGFPK